jgi:hypothetical protein
MPTTAELCLANVSSTGTTSSVFASPSLVWSPALSHAGARDSASFGGAQTQKNHTGGSDQPHCRRSIGARLRMILGCCVNPVFHDWDFEGQCGSEDERRGEKQPCGSFQRLYPHALQHESPLPDEPLKNDALNAAIEGSDRCSTSHGGTSSVEMATPSPVEVKTGCSTGKQDEEKRAVADLGPIEYGPQVTVIDGLEIADGLTAKPMWGHTAEEDLTGSMSPASLNNGGEVTAAEEAYNEMHDEGQDAVVAMLSQYFAESKAKNMARLISSARREKKVAFRRSPGVSKEPHVLYTRPTCRASRAQHSKGFSDTGALFLQLGTCLTNEPGPMQIHGSARPVESDPGPFPLLSPSLSRSFRALAAATAETNAPAAKQEHLHQVQGPRELVRVCQISSTVCPRFHSATL